MTVPVPEVLVFDLRDVTYRYHEVTALDGLNLTISGARGSLCWERTAPANPLCSACSTGFAFRRKAVSPSRVNP